MTYVQDDDFALTCFALQLRLCIGHATHGGHVRDQWDGCIENVNVWDRALSSVWKIALLALFV
jgi:hypothetical protein